MHRNLKFTLLFVFFCCRIIWSQSNIPPKIVANGNQEYCPLSEVNIVTSFNIIDPDDTGILALFIQISTGYKRNEDQLLLSNSSSHPSIATQWNSAEGKLTIKSSTTGDITYIDLIAAVKDVVFKSNSSEISEEKYFSFTIGNANFLPSTGHYYEYVSSIGITWSDAYAAAEIRDYYGLKGYLATITSSDEAILSGEQAAGAGWIGGSDAETEGVWKWVTGPEKGTTFWNGTYTGSSPNFAFWNNFEPNQAGNEDFAHITSPNIGILGSWNDLSNTGASSGDYQPKGYIVEYGGTPGDPVLDISASTKIYIPKIDTTSSGSNCGTGTVTLSASSTLGNVLWFDSEFGGTLLYSGDTLISPIISTTTTYYTKASNAACPNGERIAVIATIYEIPLIEPIIDFKNCDEDENPEDGYTEFNLNEANEIITLGDTSLTVSHYLTFNDADQKIDVINSFPFNNSISTIVYARVENGDGCHNIATINLEVSTTSFPVGYFQELESCDDDETIDGLNSFDLTLASENFIDQFPLGQNLRVQYYKNLEDAQIEQNEILPQNNYLSETPFLQTIFVRVESDDNGECFGIGPHLQLKVLPRPEFEVEPEAIVCLNSPPIALEVLNPKNNYTYEWTDENGIVISSEGTVKVSVGGVYTVIGSSSSCPSFPMKIVVAESIVANISLEDITIIDDSLNNSITVDNENNNLGIGEYEFALDSDMGPFQDEAYFDYVEAGIHTVYIRDKNNCGVSQIDVAIIGYPNFFTPNNDTINDTWQVQGIGEDFYATSLIYIFNKFGKIVANVDPTGEGWDGFYNGRMQPSADYWFRVELIDKNGNSREKTGHFSLIRR